MEERSGAEEIRERRRRRYIAVFSALALLLVAAFVLNLCVGDVRIAPGRIAGILFGRAGSARENSIILRIRLPRTLMAAVLGGALGVSGFLLQTFFMNPIAGPFVLGISSGSKMTVALVMILVISRAGRVSDAALIAASFAGAMLVTGFVIAVSRSVQGMAPLLVAGIMAGYICSAVTDFLVTFASDADIVNLHGWSRGSFANADPGSAAAAAVFIGIVMVPVILLSKPIGAYQLGERYAASVGVDTRRIRAALILLTSLLSACVTAFAGPVSFVGIAVPFLVKKLMGTAKPVIAIPGIFLGGAVVCLFCDLIARMAFSPTQLAISTVTSVFGAPVVILMLVRGRRDRY